MQVGNAQRFIARVNWQDLIYLQHLFLKRYPSFSSYAYYSDECHYIFRCLLDLNRSFANALVKLCCGVFHFVLMQLWVSPGSKAAEEKYYFDHHLAPFYRIEQVRFLFNHAFFAWVLFNLFDSSVFICQISLSLPMFSLTLGLLFFCALPCCDQKPLCHAIIWACMHIINCPCRLKKCFIFSQSLPYDFYV